jgi:L,D-transpeptidase-like protein/putative peptidoglycan binding protein
MTTRHNRAPNKIAGVLCASFFVAVAASIGFTSKSVTALAEPQGKQAGSRRAPSKRRGTLTRAMILEAQERLIELGYWIGEAEGKWGEASRAGLIAFQKVEGRPRTGKLTAAELEALNAASRPSPLESGSVHIEVDLKRQVLFVVEAGGTVSRILPVSTGDGKMFTVDDYTQPAVTPTGRFHVYRKLPGWRKSPLGLLYYPNYIVGGIAIHGNPSVPAQQASHGCVRIPMFAAEEFSEMTPIGTEVIVYDRGAASARGSPSLRQTWNHR